MCFSLGCGHEPENQRFHTISFFSLHNRKNFWRRPCRQICYSVVHRTRCRNGLFWADCFSRVTLATPVKEAGRNSATGAPCRLMFGVTTGFLAKKKEKKNKKVGRGHRRNSITAARPVSRGLERCATSRLCSCNIYTCIRVRRTPVQRRNVWPWRDVSGPLSMIREAIIDVAAFITYLFAIIEYGL